jgi:hypothetical protein
LVLLRRILPKTCFRVLVNSGIAKTLSSSCHPFGVYHPLVSQGLGDVGFLDYFFP